MDDRALVEEAVNRQLRRCGGSLRCLHSTSNVSVNRRSQHRFAAYLTGYASLEHVLPSGVIAYGPDVTHIASLVDSFQNVFQDAETTVDIPEEE